MHLPVHRPHLLWAHRNRHVRQKVSSVYPVPCTGELSFLCTSHATGVLGGLGGAANVKIVMDPAVLQQRDMLRNQLEVLESRLGVLQTAAAATTGAKTDLASQLAQAQTALAAQESELVQLKNELATCTAATAEARKVAGPAAAATALQATALQQAQVAAEATQLQLAKVKQQLTAKVRTTCIVCNVLCHCCHATRCPWQHLQHMSSPEVKHSQPACVSRLPTHVVGTM